MLDGIEHLTILDGAELDQFHLIISNCCFKDMTWSSFGKHGAPGPLTRTTIKTHFKGGSESIILHLVTIMIKLI
jgi:hypothetical protein